MGRFAPSPTGPLHAGSLVACLASYLDARARGGRWLVRMEDVDATRCRAEHAQDILSTLSAFGFTWDGEVMTQSTRGARYADALARLERRHAIFACACSRREIADSAVHGIDGPIYPGTCRDKALPATGNAMRVMVHDQPIDFVDRVQGPCTQRLRSEVGDFILRRRDGLYAYQLAVVVDDADQGVTHVVRGADLLDSTARQMHLQRLLDFPTPSYMHIPVATNADGQKLSKQTLAPALAPAEASRLLAQALSFLGQAPATAAATMSPPQLLDFAMRTWNPERIPRHRTGHIQ